MFWVMLGDVFAILVMFLVILMIFYMFFELEIDLRISGCPSSGKNLSHKWERTVPHMGTTFPARRKNG